MPGMKFEGNTESVAGAILASGLQVTNKGFVIQMKLSATPNTAAKQIMKIHSKVPQFKALIENLQQLEPKFRLLTFNSAYRQKLFFV